MTIRQYFVAQAMSALLINHAQLPELKKDQSYSLALEVQATIAVSACDIADVCLNREFETQEDQPCGGSSER